MSTEFPKEFRKEYEALRKESILTKTQLVWFKYHLGLLVKKIRDTLNRNQSRRLETKLQEGLHIATKRTIDRVYRLASIFTQEDIEELMRPSTDGYCIGWGHFEFVLVDYLSRVEAISYLHYARQHHITCSKFGEMIREDKDREPDPLNRKQIKSVEQLDKSVQGYISFLKDKDSILQEVSEDLIREWVTNMSPSDKASLVKELDDHIDSCFTFKRLVSRSK